MDIILSSLNNSKLFAGCVMLLMNLGARHIATDVPKSVENMFKYPLIRLFFVFSVVFISTRDTKISILITLIFILFFKFLLDERSKSCIIPNKFKYDILNASNSPNIPDNITPEQFAYAKEIIKKYEKQNIIKKVS